MEDSNSSCGEQEAIEGVALSRASLEELNTGTYRVLYCDVTVSV